MKIFNNEIQKRLYSLADEKYKQFSSSLLPSVKNIIGVRLPELRKIAKEISKNNNVKDYIDNCSVTYFEEIMLKGMVIAYAKFTPEERLKYIKNFVPLIDNWSVCDSFCSSLKFTKQNLDTVWEFLQPYFYSKNEFEIRFAVVMCLNYYIEEKYLNSIFDIFNNIHTDKYYAQMAVAWAVSICYIKYPVLTEAFLLNNTLDNFIYNKSLQKIIESNKIDKDTKIKIKSMRH